MAKHRAIRKPRGSSKAGRPRADGDRYPSGELKRPKPNAALAAQRASLCADPNKSTCPLDCAYANGWLSGREYGAGQRYASAYRAAGFRIASTTASSAQEVDVESELTRLSFSQMSDEIISAAWDKVMSGRGARGEQQDALLEEWNRLNRPLSAAQRQQLFLVCIMDSWPQWLVQRNAGRQLRARYESAAKAEKRALTDAELADIFGREHSHWERARDHLTSGLAKVHAALNPVGPAPAIEPTPRPKSQKRSESTVYVDEDGAFIREVVRIVPLATTS